MTVVSLVIGVLFWAALYFSRKRIVVVKRSSGTDQLTFELSRIADALDRLASQSADRAIATATRRQAFARGGGQAQVSPPPQRESQGVAYSMFGR
jgi:hypothetical protein